MPSPVTLNRVQQGVWRHYKGQHYLVLGMGNLTGGPEEGSEVVIYTPMYEAVGHPFYARPFEEWVQLVEVTNPADPSEKGLLPRYSFIGELKGD